MNILEGSITKIMQKDSLISLEVKVKNITFTSLILENGIQNYYKLYDKVNLLFKETEVMIATIESIVSARNSFVSPITYINTGEILAEIHFNFEGTKIVAVVTKQALDYLQCNIGDNFRWFVKSNEVMIAKKEE